MPVHNTDFNKDLQFHTACRNTQKDVHIYTPGLVTVSSHRQLGIRWEIMFFCPSAHGAYQLLHTDFRFLWSNSFLWINPGLYLCFSPQVPSNVCQKEFILIYRKHIDSPSASSHLSELPKCFKRETCVKPVLTLWFLSHKFALPFVKRWSLQNDQAVCFCMFIHV